MELLPQGSQNTTQVTFQDQQQINKFSTLMTHYDRLNNQLKCLEADKEQIDDVTLELELIDEDELVDFLIGGSNIDSYDSSNFDENNNGVIVGDGCFVKLKQSKVLEKLEFQSNQIEERINSTNKELDSLSKTLSELKSSLYAKFGTAINLER